MQTTTTNTAQSVANEPPRMLTKSERESMAKLHNPNIKAGTKQLCPGFIQRDIETGANEWEILWLGGKEFLFCKREFPN